MGLWATIAYAKGLTERHSVFTEPHEEGVVPLLVLPEEPVHLRLIPIGKEPPQVVFELPLPKKLDVPGQDIIRMGCIQSSLRPGPSKGIAEVNQLLDGQPSRDGILRGNNGSRKGHGVFEGNRERHYIRTSWIGLFEDVIGAEIDGIVGIAHLERLVPHFEAELRHLGCALGVTLEIEEQLGV